MSSVLASITVIKSEWERPEPLCTPALIKSFFATLMRVTMNLTWWSFLPADESSSIRCTLPER